MINSIVALPNENEHQLLFHCKYKWLSIILISYGYYIIIRIFYGGSIFRQRAVLFPSFKDSCFLSLTDNIHEDYLYKMLCIPLLQSIDLLTSRKIISTIHLKCTFWTKLLYYLHFFLIITSVPLNFVHSVSSSWKALPSILCLISFWWNNFYPTFRS